MVPFLDPLQSREPLRNQIKLSLQMSTGCYILHTEHSDAPPEATALGMKGGQSSVSVKSMGKGTKVTITLVPMTFAFVPRT